MIDEGHYIKKNEECYLKRDGEYYVRRDEECYVKRDEEYYVEKDEQCHVKGIEYIIHGTLGSMIGKEGHNIEPKK